MKQFLESNADTVAIFAGVGLAIVIVAGFAFGVSDIAGSFESAINPSSNATPSPTYNLDAAAQIDLKGLNTGR